MVRPASILIAGLAVLLAGCATPQGGATLSAAGMSAPKRAAPQEEAKTLWLERGRLRAEADILLAALQANASPDADAVAVAIKRARTGSRSARNAASLTLTDALVSLVQSRHRAPAEARTEYIDPSMDPSSRDAIVASALAAPSLEDWLARLGSHNMLHQALAKASARTPAQRDQLRASLARAAALPADLGRRHLIVDIAGQQLLMFEEGREVGRMKVVVGRPDAQTPMMAARIDHVVLNPYWNLPQDLMRSRVAEPALKRGPAIVAKRGFEALSDWGDEPERLDPRKIEWRAVATGQQELRVRQLPGPGNFMGRVKFMLPNEHGIYLHDTPEREGFRSRTRLFSNGCVRVEDYKRLLGWLFDGQPPVPDGTPEQVVQLKTPVPVYMVYMTAMPQPDGKLSFRKDVYARDTRLLAQLEREQLASR